MSKKTFFMGLAVVYLFSTPYYLLLGDTPISIWIYFQLLGLLSVIAAAYFLMRSTQKKQDRTLGNFLRIVRERSQKHKMEFIIIAGCFAVLILLPVIVIPMSDFLLDLVTVIVNVVLVRVPSFELHFFDFDIRAFIWMDTNSYVITVYLIAYFLLYWLLCKENKSRSLDGKDTGKRC